MMSEARKVPDLLLQGGTLLDPETGKQQRADLLIRDGRIVRIAPSIEANDVVVYDATGKLISPGWIDMHVHLREPGQEHKETIETGCRAAAFGGFTAVACMPNTDPPIHTRDVVEFVIERGQRTPVDVYPIACVSKSREGKELTEMADLVEGGAVAFSDDGAPVQHSGLMRRALEYASMLDRAIINHMEDLTLNPHGHMHEGVVARDVERSRGLGDVYKRQSTSRSVELVRQAKARGVPVTAEVCPHHFTLTDEAVEHSGFSTNTKMHPPLRTAADVAALKEGLRDGTIDAICTDHAPHASFEKDVEFIEAPFGIIGLETAWGLIGRELIAPGVLTVAEAVYKLTVAPRRILRLPLPRLVEGEAANLTVFDVTTRWVFEKRHIRSKSHNTPFIGETLVGRAWAIYNRGWFVSQEP